MEAVETLTGTRIVGTIERDTNRLVECHFLYHIEMIWISSINIQSTEFCLLLVY